MAENNDIIVNVKINTAEVAKKIGDATNRLRDLKIEQKALDAKLKLSAISQEDYGKQIAQVKAEIEQQTRAIKSNTAVLQAADADVKTTSDSLDEQRQYLNTLQKAYANLSGEQKAMADADGGLRDKIKEVSDSLKEQEAAIGDTRRNVGNYAESVTQAFGQMAQAGELMSPAIGLLRQMGPEGKSAANALDGLQKVMQLVGKAGKVIATSRQAEATATQGATVAQEGLNVAMSANPTGLIVAGLSTLLPIIQSFIGAIGDASKEQAEFNRELERQNYLIEQAQKDVELEAAIAEAEGKSAGEVINMRRKAAQDAVNTAEDEYQRLLDLSINGSRKERNAAKEALDEAKRQRKAAYDRLDALNNQAIVQEVKNRKQAEDKRRADAQARKEQVVKEAEDEQAALDAVREQIRRRNQTDLENELEDLRAKMDKELEIEGLTEEEKQQIRDYYRNLETQKTADAEAARLQARKDARAQFGLDPEKTPEEQELELLQIAREQDLLNAEEYEQAKTLITQKYSQMREEDIQAEVAKATELYQNEMKTAASSAGAAMNALGQLVGAFAKDSKEAGDAQKAFAFGSILLNQAMSIAEGAKAIAAATAAANTAAAAGGPAAPILAAAYTSQMVGQVIAMMASVASTIVQAKQIFDQAETHSTGGMVGGNQYTGDKVLARLNSGEGVLTAKGVENTTDLVAGLDNGTLGFNYELMAQAMSAQPAPIMDYEEFKIFENETATYKEIARV